MKHAKEILGFMKSGDYVETEGGILIHGGLLARGVYSHSVNGEDVREDTNLIPAEGITYILGASLGVTAKINTWYLALFSGNSTPAANWTNANFTANAVEITSDTEGYPGARPAWTPGTPTGGIIGDPLVKASFTIDCTTSLNIAGAGLLSTSVKGNTGAGVLASASRFASVRVVADGDAFELSYRVEMIDS